MDRWMNVDGWIGGWMDGRMERWMDGWMVEKKYQHLDTKLIFKNDGFTVECMCAYLLRKLF